MKPLDKIARGPTGIERQFTAATKKNRATPAQMKALIEFYKECQKESQLDAEAEAFLNAKGTDGRKIRDNPDTMKLVKELASEAVKKSRAKNPEAYRAYQREYMRKKRLKAKDK